MAIFFITLKAERRNGGGRQAFPFRCDKHSGEDLSNALERGEKVKGYHLVYAAGPLGEKIVTGETFRTIRDEDVHEIQQSNARFVFPGHEKSPPRAARGADGMERNGDGVGAKADGSLVNGVRGVAFHV